ncbi:MCE family protein [Pseudonocardia spinosispora]|uniref:MCE family protein n=1 Tax=Pseudonocardia spinosispora TaxID=103441 RepID=UPI00040B9797|nr:MCE family protein [Pseudonocardia spinosispora]
MNVRFREKNPVPIAVIGVVTLVVLTIVSFTIGKAPFIAGTTYYAEFAEAGGLQDGDVVRVAGVQAGVVKDIELDGAKVIVTFGLRGANLTDRSTAAIKTQTLLGKRYLAVAPKGVNILPSGSTIPLARTTAPYSVTTGVEDVTRRLGEIDTKRLGVAMDTFADSFRGLKKDDITGSLDGLTKVSETINSRDQALIGLLGNANGVTTILRDRSQQLTRLMTDGNQLLGELQRRREVIRDLLRHAVDLADQVQGTIDDNEHQIGPVLDRVNRLIDTLRDNEGNLTRTIKALGPYAQGLGDAIASGPFFEAKVENLTAGAFAPFAPYLGTLATSGPPLGPNPAGAPSPAQLPLPAEGPFAPGSSSPLAPGNSPLLPGGGK